MELSNSAVIVLVGLLSIVVGAMIGYLFGRNRNSAASHELAAEQAKSDELMNRIREKDTEVQRLNDVLAEERANTGGIERARTEAQTRLDEATKDIETLREDLSNRDSAIKTLQDAHTSLRERNAHLDANHQAALLAIDEQKQFIADANERLRETFESLSSEALRKNNSTFIELANEKLGEKVNESSAELDKRKQAINDLVRPLGQTLEKFDEKLGDIELKREGAYSEMKTLIEAMKGTTDQLSRGTTQLVSALKTSHIRGKYGEISLKRVVEVAGLSPYCDFAEQVRIRTDDGVLIPDMTINMPGHRKLILDSKVPLNAYMLAFECDEENDRSEHLKRHAVAVRDHLKKLSHKSYWEQFDEAPDFVIMYMQIESSFAAALMSDASLIEDGINKNIVLATPSTLITMLRTVGFMWQQERMAQSIYEMRDTGIELYKRTTNLLEHFSNVGTGLERAVENYNRAVASLETRFIPQAFKMKELGGTYMQKELPDVVPIETSVRPVVKTMTGTKELGDDDLLDELFPAEKPGEY